MFDDDITSALLNGINNGNAAMAQNQLLSVNNNSTNLSGNFILTPRDAIEHSITATDGDQSVLSLNYGNSFQNLSHCFHPPYLGQGNQSLANESLDQHPALRDDFLAPRQ